MEEWQASVCSRYTGQTRVYDFALVLPARVTGVEQQDIELIAYLLVGHNPARSFGRLS